MGSRPRLFSADDGHEDAVFERERIGSVGSADWRQMMQQREKLGIDTSGYRGMSDELPSSEQEESWDGQQQLWA